MTVAIAARDARSAYMVVDTRRGVGPLSMLAPIDKTFQAAGMLGSISGSASLLYHTRRAVEDAAEGLTAPVLDEEFAWSVRSHLIARIRELGWSLKKSEESPTLDYNANVLLTDGRRVFDFASDLEPLEILPGDIGIAGSGCYTVAVAYEAITDVMPELPLVERMARAAVVTCRMDTGCDLPVVAYRVDGQGVERLFERGR